MPETLDLVSGDVREDSSLISSSKADLVAGSAKVCGVCRDVACYQLSKCC